MSSNREASLNQLRRIADEDDETQLDKELAQNAPTGGRGKRKRMRVMSYEEAKRRLLDDLEANGKLNERSS